MLLCGNASQVSSPGLNYRRPSQDGDDEGERSVKNFSPVKVIRYKNYRA